MKDYIREFPQPDGSVKICEVRGGVRQPTRYVKAGQEAKAAPPEREQRPKKEPRRIPPKQTNRATAGTPVRTTPKRETRWDCAHRGDIVLGDDGRGKVVKHLCGGCPGGQIATVAFCELYQVECLPAAWAPTPEATARRCIDCGKYEKALPPAPPGE